jgi:aspartate aminotransferase-like enzyme
MHKRLFIPGPVDVKPEVLAQMTKPMIGHRSKDASALQGSIASKMRQLMYTENEIILSTSSGSGLMEGAIRSCTARRAAVFSIGAFGDRWYKMAAGNGVPADIFKSELGQPTLPEQIESALSTGEYDLITITHNETATGVANNLSELSEVYKKYPDVIVCVDAVSSLGGHKIEADAMGIDILISSSQKCLGLPPGLAVCSISEKALRNAEKVQNRGLYFDLLELYKFVKEKPHQYPSTPALSLMYALDYQLDRILAEGLDQRFDRHLKMAGQVQQWARDNFALFSNENYLSHTVTCISNTKELDVSSLNKKLAEHNYMISNGYGKIKDKTFRIAHMADTTSEQISDLLACLDNVIPSL